MPKLIEYPRTNYAGAWEVAEIVDDTGGKCAIDTAARKLNRKVSGSFKAIIGSGVKFGLLTSKRDLLTTTTLFKRIKHAYDKDEEIIFHREAFLTPPLFTQLCRKFRGRELPVQMLDVMLIREFGVEEINAQGVAKAFVEGGRMVGLLDENNIIADIDTLATKQRPRRELGTATPVITSYNTDQRVQAQQIEPTETTSDRFTEQQSIQQAVPDILDKNNDITVSKFKIETTDYNDQDAISTLFGLHRLEESTKSIKQLQELNEKVSSPPIVSVPHSSDSTEQINSTPQSQPQRTFQLQVTGPGVNSMIDISQEEDLAIALALIEKIRRQLRSNP